MISIDSVHVITNLSGLILRRNSHRVLPEDLGILNMISLSMIEAPCSVPIVLREVIIIVVVHTFRIDRSRRRCLISIHVRLMVHASIHLQSKVASLFLPLVGVLINIVGIIVVVMLSPVVLIPSVSLLEAIESPIQLTAAILSGVLLEVIERRSVLVSRLLILSLRSVSLLLIVVISL